MLSYKLFDKHPRLGGSLLTDWSFQHTGLAIETTQRGFGACSATIRLPARTARWWFGQLDGKHLHIAKNGMVVYEGRIEVIETVAEGLHLTAFGYSRAYSDIVVSDLWSTMSVAEWIPVTKDMNAVRDDQRYECDTTNRVFIGLQKNAVYPTGATAVGSQQYSYPVGSQATMQQFSANYSVYLPTNWICSLSAWNANYTNGVTFWTLTGNNAVQTGTINYTAIGGRTIVLFNVYNNTGANVTYASENGTHYASLTNVRISSTTNATLTADEIVRTLISRVKALNPDDSSSLTHRIKSPGFDLKQYSYDSVKAEEVLDQLAQLGGDGWLWSWRVWHDQILIFDRIANGGQTYQLYWQTPPIGCDLDSLITRLKPRYTDANGDEQVAADVINATAERRYGLVRSAYFDAPTTSASDATALAQAALNDKSIVNAYGDIVTSAIYQNGVRVPLWSVRSGDTIQCIQFPTTGDSDVDKTRQFRVAVTNYDHDNRTLTISPEQRQPTIDSLLARRDVSLVGK